MGLDSTRALGVVKQALFATTHWSGVLVTADQESPQARAAVEQLCRSYWFS